MIGAVIDLGTCLDLTTSSGIQQVADAYRQYRRLIDESGNAMPQNSSDLLRRNLDCGVMKMVHHIRKEEGRISIDTVRGVFVEGEPLYERSGFYAKTHIQICVCNPDCIKAVYRVDQRFLA